MPDNVSAENQPDPKKDAAVQSSAPPEVALRAPVPADVPLLFAFESDPAWCAMAMLKPRSRQAFEAVWAGMFRDWAAEEARASGETRASRESLTSAESIAAGKAPAAGQNRFFQRTILADGQVCGTIGVRPVGAKNAGSDGLAAGGERFDVGYGLGRAHWGRGIASRALALLLAEVPHRPLYATVAASNAASIRVLEKHGFRIVERFMGEETERYLPCEEVTMTLP